MDLWTALLDVLIVLAAALALGGLCERLRQSAILGYLLAGTLLGPNALDWMLNHRAVAAIAELGVALLLFTIGLECSWWRLRTLGRIAVVRGVLQVLVTGVLSAGLCRWLGLPGPASVAIGAMIALSSTACVLRVLVSRAEIDSVYGRNALGILLLQDIALVPLVLLVTAMGHGGSIPAIGWALSQAIGVAALLVGGLYLLFNYVVPVLLSAKEAARNRELPILLAIVTAVGTAWASHELGLSPALGAFVAGMLLAESPFATQIRADVAPLRTLFVTLFFSSIGMLADPAWAVRHWTLLAAVVAAIVFGKAVLTFGVARLCRSSLGYAVATGVCLAQVGEFSFVLAEAAKKGGLINGDLFKLIVSATIATLFLTPYLVTVAPHLVSIVGRLSACPAKPLPAGSETALQPDMELSDHVIIVGFGPAGQRVAEALMECDEPLVVVELNPKSAAAARGSGLVTCVGDATRMELLERLRIGAAKAVAVTLPDPATTRQVIEQVRSLSPQTPIIVRARYHRYRPELQRAGAQVVVDEEDQVGLCIASEVQKKLRLANSEPEPPYDEV